MLYRLKHLLPICLLCISTASANAERIYLGIDVLEKSGFKYEGVAQSYLQIDGRWRTHVLYAALRNDRRGRTDVG